MLSFSLLVHKLRPENIALTSQLAQLGHGWIREIAWSPDGKTLAAAGSLGVWLYNVNLPAKEPTLLSSGNTPLESLDFSPDGKLIAAGSSWKHQPEASEIWIWDVQTGEKIDTLSVPDPLRVPSVRFHPKDNLLFSSGHKGMVRIWDVASLDQIEVFQAYEGQVNDLAFSPNGEWLASASSYLPAVQLWNAQTLELVGSIKWNGIGRVQSIAFGPDSRYLAIGGEDQTMRLWEVATGMEYAVFNQDRQQFLAHVWSVDYSPKGIVAYGGTTGEIHLGDVATQKAIASLEHNFQWVRSLAFNPDGSLLACNNSANLIHLWDVRSGKLLTTLGEHTFKVNSITFSPSGKQLAYGSADINSVNLWDIETGDRRTFLGGSKSVTISPDDKLLAAETDHITIERPPYKRDRRKGIRIWNTETGQELWYLSDYSASRTIFYPDTEKVLLVLTQSGNKITFWDLETLDSEHATLIASSRIMSNLALSGDGKWLAYGDDKGHVSIWNIKTHKVHTVSTQFHSQIRSIALNSDGNLAAFGYYYTDLDKRDAGLVIWNIEAGEYRVLQNTGVGTDRLDYSPDSTLLAAGNAEGHIQVWDTQTGEELVTLYHNGPVTSVTFNPDGTLIASGSSDGTVRLWGLPLDK